MGDLLIALAWLVAANLWLALGAWLLAAAVARSVVARPDNVIHGLVLMSVWPLLLARWLWLACQRRPGSGAAREPIRRSRSVN